MKDTLDMWYNYNTKKYNEAITESRGGFWYPHLAILLYGKR